MYEILKIAGLVLKEISSIVSNQLFWMIVLLLVLLYKKSSNIEKVMLGRKFSLIEKVSASLVNGIIGGLLGSFLVMIIGITLINYNGNNQDSLTTGIMYIWLLAVFLAMINPRYLCFSYAGGIIALINLLFGVPEINVPGLLALIGILHLIESFLIRLDGHSHAVPVFLKKKCGTIVGGYIMNKMWPIPLVLLAFGFTYIPYSRILNLDSMPTWWPIMKQTFVISGLSYLPFIIPVVLGYGDMAITKTPEKRCRESALKLGIYSIILILLAVLSSKLIAFAYIAAIFAPLAHELLIIYGKKEEEKGKPLFDFDGKGLTVLYTKKNSPAYKMNLEPGDKILKVNNSSIKSELQLAEILSESPKVLWMEIRKLDKSIISVDYQDYRNGIKGLGALIVPQNASVYFELKDPPSTFRKLYDFIIKKIKNK